MTYWSKPKIPHKGWKYIKVVDLGEGVAPGESISYEYCEMCGEKIRYVHILTHLEYDGEIHVGCDCAAKLTEDYINPEEHERRLINKSNRRTTFLKRKWTYKSETGNYTLRYKRECITIMRSRYDSGWGVIFRGEQQWKYKGMKIRDFDTAVLAAFELFDELYDL